MDISETLAPNSDQLDAIELVAGPRTFVVESVSKGNAEQPVNVHLVGFPRPWRPGKSMRRVLAFCWTADASTWVGRSVELYCDPEVSFGKDKVGGTRIKSLSHIEKPMSIPLLVSRGRSAMFKVVPLTEATPTNTGPTPAQINASTDVAELKAMWKATTDKSLHKLIEGRVAELSLPQSGADVDPNPELTL